LSLQPLKARLPHLTLLSSPGAGAQLGFAAVPGAPPGEGAEGGIDLVEQRSGAAARMAGNAKVSPVETRQSHCNAPDKNAAVAGGNISNQVTTAKYTIVTFLPINLTSQFSRLANVYFLVISCLQLFTPLSPTSRYSTAAPFAFVLLLNMVRELFEDSARHKADKEVNDRLVEVIRPSGSTESVPWRSLVLGDLVWVKSNNEFPADLVLISSSGDQGMCYIDTCNLDGTISEKYPMQ
jgi:magnesium-transporting ATPase (P-type)